MLQSLLDKYSKFCVKDSYSFVQMLRSTAVNQNLSMCSFDMRSLFTNIPLQEVITICIDDLFANDIHVQGIEKEILQESLTFATTDVQFSFDDAAYRQIGGIAMGLPLGLILANIFVGYMEEQLFRKTVHLIMYVRYVDDVLAVFETKHDSTLYLDHHSRITSIHVRA